MKISIAIVRRLSYLDSAHLLRLAEPSSVVKLGSWPIVYTSCLPKGRELMEKSILDGAGSFGPS
jgi:hypothetical protein